MVTLFLLFVKKSFIVNIYTLFKNEKKIYRTFSDGEIIRSMKINGPYILLRVYLDAFGTNNPIGSSRDKDKILGMYYSPFASLHIGSRRSMVQTIALLEAKDVENFGLKFCLENTMAELKHLVTSGIYDEKTKNQIQIRIIASLGDNLEQVQIAGILQNFATMEHACRKEWFTNILCRF